MKSVPLPGDKSAVVYEIHELKRSHVRKAYRLVDEQSMDSDKRMDAFGTLRDAAMTILIESWDLGEVSYDTVVDLPLETYEALKNAMDDTIDRIMELGQAPDPKSDPSSSQPASTD